MYRNRDVLEDDTADSPRWASRWAAERWRHRLQTEEATICGHSVICSVFSDARNFDALFGDDTADSPRWASRWAAESVALLQSVSAAYAFRFSTNPDSANPNSKIKKVGPAADIVQPPAERRSVTTFSDVMADRKAHPCPLLACVQRWSCIGKYYGIKVVMYRL